MEELRSRVIKFNKNGTFEKHKIIDKNYSTKIYELTNKGNCGSIVHRK